MTGTPKFGFFGQLLMESQPSDKESIESILGFDCDDEGYARRSAVYAAIFGTLDLSNWLYGRDGRFERIRMSGLTSQEGFWTFTAGAALSIKKIKLKAGIYHEKGDFNCY